MYAKKRNNSPNTNMACCTHIHTCTHMYRLECSPLLAVMLMLMVMLREGTRGSNNGAVYTHKCNH